MRDRFGFPLLAAAAFVLACGPSRPAVRSGPSPALAATAAFSEPQSGTATAFDLHASAFAAGGRIPERYTCDGANVSPALSWTDAPAGTKTLALIADDPDTQAGTWTHWVLWNLPAEPTALPAGTATTETLENGARQGQNDFGRLGYGGPCPPAGPPHHYFFKLFALNARLELKPGALRRELETAMQGHVLARAEWVGTYGR